MRFYVTLSRRIREYRGMTVEAATPEEAHKRALKLAREVDAGVTGAEKPEEDAGEWCDSTIGRAHVDSITKEGK